jgi:hypothetical protein
MSYKVLMAHLDLDDDTDGRMSLSVELAGRFDAALIGTRPGRQALHSVTA